MEFFIANLAPIMFGGLVIFLLSGFPVAFSLAANGLFFGFVGIELGLLKPKLLQALPNRIFGIMANDTLLAIPFFTFMGLILERSGMAEDLLDTIGQLFGPIRGGVAYAVIFVGALLAATTGVVAASVISMGLISLPVMLRYGYDRRLASGVIAASGTLAQIIPPSLVLIVMADQLGRCVGDMYKAAFIPGLMLTAMYAGYVSGSRSSGRLRAGAAARSAQPREDNGSSGCLAAGAVGGLRRPAVLLRCTIADFISGAGHPDDRSRPMNHRGVAFSSAVRAGLRARADQPLHAVGLLSRMAERVMFVLIPPLALIFLVLGTIFLGIATPTEGGGMGALGRSCWRWSRRRLSCQLLQAGDGLDHPAVLLRDVHPDRLDGVQPGLPGRERRPGSSTC